MPGYNTAHVILRRAAAPSGRSAPGSGARPGKLRQAAPMYRAWRELRKVV